MRSDCPRLNTNQHSDQLHALVLDAWRSVEPKRDATVETDLGARIARLARLAAARHLAIAATTFDGSEL